MKKALVISLIVLALGALATWHGCRYDWNPHYIANKAVFMVRPLYNADSSAAVVSYVLDIGAFGTAGYQTLLRKEDYQGDLTTFMLPVEYIAPVWRGKDTLEVIYNEAEAFLRGGNTTHVNKERDTVVVNGIVILVKERRLNLQKAKDNYYKRTPK
ncbi:MAG: hypothetical protein ACRYG7_00415 [Janthinobacterium lividum]